MAYMLLIVEPLDQRAERGIEEGKRVYERMLGYTADLRANGVLIASSSLDHVARGKRLRVRGGRKMIVDGPFAETKEMIGGFFLIDVASREEALAWAERCPAAEWATIEIRETGPCYLSS